MPRIGKGTVPEFPATLFSRKSRTLLVAGCKCSPHLSNRPPLPCGPWPPRCCPLAPDSKGCRFIPSGIRRSRCGRGEDYFPPGVGRPIYPDPAIRGKSHARPDPAGNAIQGRNSLADVPYWRKSNYSDPTDCTPRGSFSQADSSLENLVKPFVYSGLNISQTEPLA